MKKILFVVTMFLTSMVYAQQQLPGNSEFTNSITVISKKQSQYNLIYPSKTSGKVRVSIFNEKGNLLQTNNFKSMNGISFTYDLSNLPKGNYHVKLQDGKNVHSVNIAHQILAPEIPHITLTEVGNEKRYNLIVERENMKPVWVNIFDSESRIIYTDKIDVNYNFSRIYDLSKFSAKASAIEVYSDGKMVKKAIY